jgi:hypothetical protein
MTDRLRYDDDKAFLLADDASTIARIVRTVPAAKLRGTKLDEWTALEVIGHVTDAAEIFADRVQRCVDEENPRVASYDQDAIARERRTASAIRWSFRGGWRPRIPASSSCSSGPAPPPARASTATGARSTPATSPRTRPTTRTGTRAISRRSFRPRPDRSAATGLQDP